MTGSGEPEALTPLRPPAPVAPPAPLSPLGLIKALWSNPLEAWSERYFRDPVVVTKLMFCDVAVVSDPAGFVMF